MNWSRSWPTLRHYLDSCLEGCPHSLRPISFTLRVYELLTTLSVAKSNTLELSLLELNLLIMNEPILHNLYSSANIIRMIKSRRITWAGHVARMGETRILVGKPEGKRPLGRLRRRWRVRVPKYTKWDPYYNYGSGRLFSHEILPTEK
jgi:hypothetical protein